MEGRLIEIRGKKLYVEEFGAKDKQPVLYLHGGPGESCFDFTYHQKERLQDHFHVIAIDQRGVCRSEIIESHEHFTLMDIIKDCEELRDHLQINQWSVIGHSFGGYLALLYAATFPSSIHKVIFECPTFDFELTSRFLLKKTANLARKYDNEALAQKCMELSWSKDKSPQQLTEGYMELSDGLGDSRIEIYRYITDNPTDYNAAYTDEEWDKFYNRSEIHYDRLREEGRLFESLLPRLKEVKNPMLLMTAEHDAATCDIHRKTFTRNAANGEVHYFEKCGHTPHYETPDRFREVVVDYLNR
ncbi:alpha/beta fold hydrolase [Halobacillus sp. MO56]